MGRSDARVLIEDFAEASHRFRLGRQLHLAGIRLQGTHDGRPVEIEVDGRELVLRVMNPQSAWRLRRNLSAITIPLLRTLRDGGFGLRLSIGRHLSLRVFPNAHFVIRPPIRALRLL